jgi:hypothetical protein
MRSPGKGLEKFNKGLKKCKYFPITLFIYEFLKIFLSSYLRSIGWFDAYFITYYKNEKSVNCFVLLLALILVKTKEYSKNLEGKRYGHVIG